MQNIQETRDFYLAAYLLAIGIKLQSHNKINGSTIFNFRDEDRTQEAIKAYYSMSDTIAPITYGNAIKAIKTIVHSYDKTNSRSEGNYVKQYKGSARV
jgi:hypothetical protein